jgi:hypothetical protein
MTIIGNIQNNIAVIYEIKSFHVTLAAGNFFFQKIYIKKITILPIVQNLKNPIIPPYYCWVILCTVKDLLGKSWQKNLLPPSQKTCCFKIHNLSKNMSFYLIWHVCNTTTNYGN